MLAHRLHATPTGHETFDHLVSVLHVWYGTSVMPVRNDYWLVEVLTDGGRSQVVHMVLLAFSAARDARCVFYSPVGPISPHIDLEDLLRRNAALDLGGLCIDDVVDVEGTLVPHVVMRSSRRLHSLQVVQAWEDIQHVAHVADWLERDIFAQDVR